MSDLFVIQPLGGLCNNLRVLLSCVDYCNRMNLKLLCVWDSWQNNVDFNDFFQPIDNVDFTCSYEGYINYRSCYAMDRFGKEIISSDFTTDTARLILKPEIKKLINDLPITKKPFVSCHVRRGDHKKVYRNLSYYFKSIDNLSYDFIHLCTDDPHIQDEFSDRYKNKVWYYNKITKTNHLSRDTSPVSTIIDLFLPLQAKDFIGTEGSTFSSFIKKIRNEIP